MRCLFGGGGRLGQSGLVALGLLGCGELQAQPARVNLAKYQAVATDSAASGKPALFVTDGVAGNTNSWRSSGAGPHWAVITLPLAMELGSAQLYLGSDDTSPVANFALQYQTNGSWVAIPGADFAGNTATVLNVVFGSPVTAAQVRFYSPDATVTVREIALFPPNGPSGYPLGTDATLNLAQQCAVKASSAAPNHYPKLAVDGHAAANSGGWQSANVSGPHTLDIVLPASTRIASAHLYSGSATATAITDFTLQYWSGSAWVAIPGGTVTGNTQRERVVPFSAAVQTAQVRLSLPGNGPQIVRELALFAAATGVTGYPLGTGVATNDQPAMRWHTFGDRFWSLINRASSNALTAGIAGASEAVESTNLNQQFQALYNLDSDTFRLRSRETGQCLAAQHADRSPGTGVILNPAYSALPHELWRFEEAGSDYFRLINVWNGLALESDGLVPPTVALAAPSPDPRQQWRFTFKARHPKKGTAGYGEDWSRFGSSWTYNWSRDSAVSLPPHVGFLPTQWNGVGVDTLPQYYPAWHTNPKPVGLLAFNEPDLAGQANMSVSNVIALWPQLEATDMPLASPATAWAFSGWLGDFYTQATNLGLRVDYTAVHWYAYPIANDFINHLQNIHATWGRPLWITEFSCAGSGVWTEEDCYRFLAEFLWRAEDLDWLERYSIFCFSEDPPTNPWDRTSPPSAVFRADGATFNAFGELYAGWDADRTIRPGTAYLLHNKGASFRIGNSGAAQPVTSNIRTNDLTVQWRLFAAPSTNRWYLESLWDGKRLLCNGSALSLVAAGTAGPLVEWTYTAETNGYFFIDHPVTARRLRLSRVNNASGAPTAVSLATDSTAAVNDFVRWRFIKPSLPVPGGLTATPGNGRVILNWRATPGAASYTVKRARTAGGPYWPVAAGINSTNYTHVGVANGVTGYYVVSAVNTAGESAYSREVAATPSATRYAVNCGGNAADWFSPDAGFSGGATASSAAAIDLGNLTNPAPQAVYQSERYGNCSYTFTNLTASMAYRVRLHFAETYWSAAGQRRFNVTINGTSVLSSFDVFSAAGAKYKAVIREFSVPATATGRIVIQFTTVTDNAKISGIEIIAPYMPPQLEARLASSDGPMILTWPEAAAGFTLFRATNLFEPTVWVPVAGTPTLEGTNLSVAIPITNGPGFFRLAVPQP